MTQEEIEAHIEVLHEVQNTLLDVISELADKIESLEKTIK